MSSSTKNQHGQGGLVPAQASHGKLFRLPLGQPGNVNVGRQVAAFRRAVEAELLAQDGQVGVAAAKRVRTACLALRQSLRIARILATAGEPGREGGLSHETWLGYSDRMLRAEETCDRALSAIGLEAKRTPPDPWKEVYDQAVQDTDSRLPDVVQPTHGGTGRPAGQVDALDAPESRVGNSDGAHAVSISSTASIPPIAIYIGGDVDAAGARDGGGDDDQTNG